MDVIRNHVYMRNIVEKRRNSVGENVRIIVFKLLLSSNLVVLELVNSK